MTDGDAGNQQSHAVDPGGTVLFVDDDPAILSALLRAFAPLPTVTPLIAPNGTAALEVLKRFPVDVIVADQKMPGITGNGLLAKCRRLYPFVARILLTAYADRQTVSAAVTEGGADLVFCKPWDDEGLKNGILAALAKASKQRRAAQLQAWAGPATDRLQNAAEDLVAQLEARDPATALHSWRAAEFTRLFGDDLGLSAADLYVAALLHDVGMGSPEKGHDGDGDERIRDAQVTGDLADPHTIVGETMVLRLQGGTRIAPWIRHHHESYDGSGFPEGLRGTGIPLGARVLRVVDAYDDMVSQGKKAVNALQVIMHGAGTEFDPRIAKRFVMRALEMAAAGKSSP